MSTHDLDRFVNAQDGIYGHVVAELSAGRKRSHWMWFIFPQIAGLGFSTMAQHYTIASSDEARDYLAHDVLGQRLVECTKLVLVVPDQSITEIFGQPDDVKFRSSMTLFHLVSQHGVFADAIERFFPAGPDLRTLEMLKSDRADLVSDDQLDAKRELRLLIPISAKCG